MFYLAKRASAGRSRSPHRYDFAGPWLTSVGGTTGARPQVAADLSEGGFSNYFPTPPYQRVAVPTYVRGLRGQYGGLYKFVFFRNMTRARGGHNLAAE